MSKSLDELQQEITAWGHEKGWTFKPEDIPEKLMLVCCELAEAMEHYRHDRMFIFYDEDGKPDGFLIELADAVIRILHLVGPNIKMSEAIEIKMKYNHTRPYRHGGLKA